MEKITNVFITLVLAAISSLAIRFGFEYLSQVRTFEQSFTAANLLVLMAILMGTSLYFTVTQFRDAKV